MAINSQISFFGHDCFFPVLCLFAVLCLITVICLIDSQYFSREEKQTAQLTHFPLFFTLSFQFYQLNIYQISILDPVRIEQMVSSNAVQIFGV
jgi:hypothetical protein